MNCIPIMVRTRSPFRRPVPQGTDRHRRRLPGGRACEDPGMGATALRRRPDAEILLLAAAALGVGAQWNTDWIAYDAEIMKAMGLSASEKIVGIIYFGTPGAPLEDRPRPDPESLITRWRG